MERAAVGTTSPGFVRWEEVYVSSDRGRREVHYYLKRKDGTSDLAVVGKEKSLRHMSYHYVIRDRSLLSISPSSSLLKLRSRREVIDWLNTIVPGSNSHSHRSLQAIGGSLDNKNGCELDVETLKSPKLGQYTTEFLWIGSSWTCKKRRRHYRSFFRNGVKISVHDFVYVLAEEDKRLVAYLDDMYEDSRGNKMVVVQWFHKYDEVAIDLPHNYHNREIFFSFCLQDLSIECIDGLTTVLSPHHHEKFLNEASHTQLEPFVCCRLFDNDDVKPFDITRIKGYWNQEILRYMFMTSPSKCQLSNDGLKEEGHPTDAIIRPRKRLCRSKDCDMYLQSANNKKNMHMSPDVQDAHGSVIDSKGGIQMCNLEEGCSAMIFLSGKEAPIKNHPQPLAIGSEVEVLSLDSGIRGCWFRARIIKKHKDKIKVRYQDIKDAADEANHLEEWVLASKVVLTDESGIWNCGRTIVRPTPPSNKGRVSSDLGVGTIVDVWWHDGWWEGIVIQKESEDRRHVYFPGEKQESIFNCSDLRLSQEWLGNEWKCTKARPDYVTSILSGHELKQGGIDFCNVKADQAAIANNRDCTGIVHKDGFSVNDDGCCNPLVDARENRVKLSEVAWDLSKDDLLAQLKWKSSRKRRHSKSFAHKVDYRVSLDESSPQTSRTRTCEKFFIPSSLKIDRDNCKYIGDSFFGSSVVPPLTSLVMSR